MRTSIVMANKFQLKNNDRVAIIGAGPAGSLFAYSLLRLAKKENIALPHSKWNGNFQKPQNCICYNLCYNEGTSQEIIHIDRQAGMSCLCYNTSYNGEAKPQYRTLQELDKQRSAELRIIKAAKKLIEENIGD